jgi:hypothetical protein
LSAATAPPLPVPAATFLAGSRRREPWPVQAPPPAGGPPPGPRVGERPPPRAGLPGPARARGRCEPPPQRECLHRGQASWPRRAVLLPSFAPPKLGRRFALLRPSVRPALLCTSVGAASPCSPAPLRPSTGPAPPLALLCSARAQAALRPAPQLRSALLRLGVAPSSGSV